MIHEDRYTLRGMAKLLGVSTGLIYKIETALGLRGWSSQLSGKKSLYTEAQKDFFLRVILMRNLGFSLADIKALYESERRLNRFVTSHFLVEPPEGGSAGMMRAMRDKTYKPSKTRHLPIFLIQDISLPGYEIEYDRGKFEQDLVHAAELKRLYAEYQALYRKTAEEAERRQQEIAKRQKQLKAVASYQLR